MPIKNDITQYLKAAILLHENKSLIFSYSQEINLNTNWNNLLSHKKQIFHINYSNNEGYIGFGICKTYDKKSKKDIKQLKNITSTYQSYGSKTTLSLKLFGGVSFNIDQKSDSIWADVPKALFYLPKLLLTKQKNKYYLSFNKILNKQSDINKINAEYISYVQLIKDFKYRKKKNNISFKEDIPTKQQYEKKFNSYIHHIKSKNIKKVILSRTKIFSSKSEVNLRKVPSDSTNFSIKLNKKKCFFGTTPEILIETKNKDYNTLALAGTLIKNKNKVTNNKLLNDKKELQEHQYVVDNIVNTLNPFSSKISFKKKPTVLELEHLYHLSTPISGTLINKMHILDLLFKLYPTPAVLGLPEKDALKLILKYESIDRGWYSGCIGWFDLDGNGRFDVAIRSALQDKNTIYFYAGGGILKESNLDKEWDETESKFLQLLSIL